MSSAGWNDTWAAQPPDRALAPPPASQPAEAGLPASNRARVGRRTVSSRSPRGLAPDDDAAEVARQVCLDQLSHRARTRSELAAVLAVRGVPDDVADRVLDRLTEVGLVDDASFAQAWVASRSAVKGLARGALSQELRRRGVPGPTVESAVSAVTPDDELRAARALVARRLAATAGLETGARVRRLVAMLGRKGYPSGQAYEVVREALAAERTQGEGEWES